MRIIILRACAFSALITLAVSAHANPRETAIRRAPAIAPVTPASPGVAPVAPGWMTDALLASVVRPVQACAHAATGAEDVTRQSPPRPSQNSAFPAAFVFQSNSALFLAAEFDDHDTRRIDSISG